MVGPCIGVLSTRNEVPGSRTHSMSDQAAVGVRSHTHHMQSNGSMVRVWEGLLLVLRFRLSLIDPTD